MVSAYIEQSQQLPLELAARVTGLPATLLRKLVRDGVLPGEAPFRVQGVLGICDLEKAQVIARQLEASRVAVNDKSIRPAEAAERYGFSRDTVYTWLKKGWIRQQGTEDGGDLLVNEGDIAFARALADLSGQKQGKPVFPHGDGPYRTA